MQYIDSNFEKGVFGYGDIERNARFYGEDSGANEERKPFRITGRSHHPCSSKFSFFILLSYFYFKTYSNYNKILDSASNKY